MTYIGVFQPVCTVNAETGEIDMDWFQAWTHSYDETAESLAEDYDDDHGTADKLDARLEAIRHELDGAQSRLADLVAPFFKTGDTA